MNPFEVSVAGQYGNGYSTGSNQVVVEGLNGLASQPDLTQTVSTIVNSVGYDQARGIVAQTLNSGPQLARDAIQTAQLEPEISPTSILTPEGAAQVGVAAKKAQAAAKLHKANADKAEGMMRRALALTKKTKDPNQIPQLEAEAALHLKDVVQNRIAASRAVAVSGAARAALKFRAQALRESNPEKRNARLGQAAAAIDAGQALARTKAQVELPAQVAAAGTTLRSFAQMQPVTVKQIPGAQPPRIPFGETPPIRGHIPQRIPAGVQTPPIIAVGDREVIVQLAGLGEGGFDISAIFNNVVQSAKNMFPADHIVGQVLNGNWSGAASSAGQLVSQALQPQNPPPTKAAVPPSAQQVQVAIQASSNEVKPAGMTSPFAGLPGWVLPAGLVSAVGAAALLLL